MISYKSLLDQELLVVRKKIGTKMEEKLTAYLIRTLPAKPTGLKVKLKVLTVKKEVITFDEKQNPVATVLPHGLYLAGPTPQSIKDPMLLGILNQFNLQMQELEFEMKISCNRPPIVPPGGPKSKIQSGLEPENLGTGPADPNQEEHRQQGTSVTQLISWTKQGITKSISQTVEINSKAYGFFKEQPKQPEATTVAPPSHQQASSSMEEKPSPTPKPPVATDYTKVFLSIMQSLLLQYKPPAATLTNPEPTQTKQTRATAESPETPKPQSKSRETLKLDTSRLRLLGYLVRQAYREAAYLRLLLAPTDPVQRATHQQLFADACSRLLSLLNAFQEFILEPFSIAFTKFEAGNSKVPTDILKVLFEQLKSLVKSLKEFAINPPASIFDSDFDPNFWDIVNSSELEIDEIFEPLLTRVVFEKEFFTQLETNIEKYPLESRNVKVDALYTLLFRESEADLFDDPIQRISARQRFHQMYEVFLKGDPESKICVTRNTKSGAPTRFFEGFETENDWKLLAVVCKGDIKICIIIEHIRSAEKDEEIYLDDSLEEESLKITTHVIVYRQDLLIGSFKLDPGNGLAAKFSDRLDCNKLYFTGRYLLSIPSLRYSEISSLTAIDLSPCFESTPKPPISRKNDLPTLMPGCHWPPLASACTDQFVSIMTCWPNKGLKIDHKHSQVKSFQLHFLLFNKQDFEVVGPIPKEKESDPTPYTTSLSGVSLDPHDPKFCVTQLCWLKGLTKLFYMSWSRSSQIGNIDDQSILEEEVFDYEYDDDSQQSEGCEEPESGVDTAKTLFIACFEVPRALNNIKKVACESFNMDTILKDQPIVGGMLLSFSSLGTSKKEYLLMDVMRRYGPDFDPSKQIQTIIARKLLTVHKQKLHWVLILRNQADPFPHLIGTQITCAGYETSHMSLFHMRRVFSSDKVISAIYRLSYKAL